MSAVLERLMSGKSRSAEEKQITDDTIAEKAYIEAANNASLLYDYGDLISREWLLLNFAIEEPETGTKEDFNKFAFEFMQNIEGFKRVLLEEHKMLLESVRGHGYRIVMPAQQSTLAMAKLKNAVSSEMKRAITTLSNINDRLLTDEDVRRADEHRGKIAAMSAFSNKRLS